MKVSWRLFFDAKVFFFFFCYIKHQFKNSKTFLVIRWNTLMKHYRSPGLGSLTSAFISFTWQKVLVAYWQLRDCFENENQLTKKTWNVRNKNLFSSGEVYAHLMIAVFAYKCLPQPRNIYWLNLWVFNVIFLWGPFPWHRALYSYTEHNTPITISIKPVMLLVIINTELYLGRSLLQIL